ncbi:thiamine ABC transporter substrate-binding protein [Pyrobaculum neutrophilum]|uniref:ABC transporter, periplasmic binding protein, thiB subfamily n=1 Tax=Pyrobaculum neutrophilum (strain DSM 2338 / JCM 9278 / NBRC 100436 / V24Sta) TaxID=444157 RepID=B1YE07_PYRNV|nr:thiamine ABC transporter substrate-binding protein [Pyrobaculum neutrophilum]ACB40020.1 ABC transporter, periplasmic binding protein, thiB subfamily [Pyrobaculum neutrophilum V24Sta]
MSIRGLLAAVVVVAAVLAALMAWQSLQQQMERKLVIVGPAGIGDLGRELARRFSERYGVNATFVALGGAVEMVNELVRNRDNPPWDVAIGVPEFYYTVLVEKGVLYCPGFKVEGVPAEEYWDPHGCVYPLDKSYIGIVYNESALAARGLKPPQTLDDLLKPEYRGLITYPNPVQSGTGLAVLSWVMSVKGEEEGWRYLKQLSSQISKIGYPSGFTPLRSALKRGDVLIALSWYSHAIDPGTPSMKAATYSAFLYKEGVAVLKNARNRDLALEFVKFALSKEGQDLVDPYNYMLPVRPDAVVKNNLGLPRPQSVVVYNPALGSKADEWRLRWQREIASG